MENEVTIQRRNSLEGIAQPLLLRAEEEVGDEAGDEAGERGVDVADAALPIVTQRSQHFDVEQPPLVKKHATVWQQLRLAREDAIAAGINPGALERLWLIEHSFYGRYRFANLAIMPEKFLRYLFTREVDMAILHRQLSYKPSPRLLSAGRGIPLRSERAIRRVYATNAFVYGFEFGLISGIKFSLLSLLLYQIFNAGSVTDFLSDLLHGKQKSIYAILTKFDSSHGRYLGLLFALPFVLAIARALYASTQAKPLTAQYWQAADDFFTEFREHISEPLTAVKFWHRSLYWMIPLVPGKRRLTMFTDALCWDGRLTNDQRRQAFEWINGVAQGNGYAQFIAMQRLARLVHGVSLRQSDLIKKYYDSETEQLFWKIKTDALIALTKKALSPREAWKQRKPFSTLYAHYLKWTLADSATQPLSAIMLLFKLTKTTASLWVIKTFLQALINYLHCPEEYQSGFTLAGGLANWASKNTQACFEEYVALFSNIPGQPVETLTSIIPSFDLRNMSSLDLSNKGLNGTQVAKILIALREQRVPLTHLNVSGNVINEPVGLGVLFPQLTAITDLDFSSNGLVTINPDSHSNSPRGSAEGLMSFAQGLSQLTQLQALRLAQNSIGMLDLQANGLNSTIYLGQALYFLVNVRVLDLSENGIGSNDGQNSNGTQAIGAGVGKLFQLRSLDLSGNGVGSNDEQNSHGTQAIGAGVSKLFQLRFLDLSRNGIGAFDYVNSQGTQAIGIGIERCMQLQVLDLSRNVIGVYDAQNSKGTQAIGQGIAQLSELQVLDLSENQIGFRDQYNSNGTQTIGQGIAQLKQLQSLDLSGNNIGYEDEYNSNGTQAIGEGLRALSNLQILALGGNDIGTAANSTGTLSIAEALPFLSHLIAISIVPLASLDNAVVLLNAVRQLPEPIHSDLPTLLYLNEVAPYFESVCRTNTTLSLGGKLQSLPTTMWVAIGSALAHCTGLTSLDLSGNNFAENDYYGSSTQAMGQGIAQLRQLQSLDLSGNVIGNLDSINSSGTQAIGEGIAQLSQLQFLDLSENPIGSCDQYYSQGVLALVQGIAQLRQLQSLDLSKAEIGNEGENSSICTQAIGEGIAQLKQLRSLDLSGNWIGVDDEYNSTGTQAIGEGIAQLRQLQSLDLSGNFMGFGDQYNSQGTQAIVYAISRLNQLSVLDFSGSYLGYQHSLSVQLLGQSLSSLNQLRQLSLEGPPPTSSYLSGFIGSTDDLGVIAITNGIRHLTNLCEINLDNNQIGRIGPNGSLALLEVIPTLPNLKIIGLAGIQNVTWTQQSQALNTVIQGQLQIVCYAQRCFADSGLIPQGTCEAFATVSPSAVVSSAFFARQLSQPIENPIIPAVPWQCEPVEKQLCCVSGEGATRTITPLMGYTLSDVATDNAQHCDTHTEQGMQVTHCIGEKSEYVELHPQSDNSLLSTLGSAILMGAVYTALPEALGDALSLSGLVSHENAERVKTAANVALTVTMGSYWATAASYATQATLQRLGVSAEKSRVAANSAAFVVNTVRDFTPLGIAVTGANYVAGRFTLWAEKKAARSIAARLQPASTTSPTAAFSR